MIKKLFSVKNDVEKRENKERSRKEKEEAERKAEEEKNTLRVNGGYRLCCKRISLR